jgi:hypothetical protein
MNSMDSGGVPQVIKPKLIAILTGIMAGAIVVVSYLFHAVL